MKILVFEENLMWSSRLLQSIRGLGHVPVLTKTLEEAELGADAAIVNLGQASPDPSLLISHLQSRGIPVIAHAGHREKELMELGKSSGARFLATNRELTFNIEQLLDKACHAVQESV